MSRLRTVAGLIVLTVSGLLITPAAALAATPLRATITCDAATGAITTRASGNLLVPGPPTPVVVEFQRRGGTRVTATTSTSLSPLPQPFTTRVTSTSSGDVSATGYTGTFDPATSVYYREALVVTFKNPSTGAILTTREATCDYDRRTTVALTCDPAAGTVTATVTGVNGQSGTSDGGGRPRVVAYRSVTIMQATKDGPRFTGQQAGGWDVQHRVTQAADGTWADTGFVNRITSNPYYYAEELTVGIFDQYGAFVGSGAARCTLFDGSSTPAA